MTQHGVWIIGASTGIGAALAQELVRRGKKVALSARSIDTLEKIHRELPPVRSPNDEHIIAPLDVTDECSLHKAKEQILEQWKVISSMVFMAGIYEPMQMGKLNLPTVRNILNTNLLGAFYTAETVLPVLLAQGYGQMAFCSSIAGYSGLPNSQPYGASKAGLTNMVESLKSEHGGNIDIKIIHPGFVESRLTAKNDFAMPMKISSRKAAKIIADGLESKVFEIHFPKKMTVLVKILSLMPYKLYFWLTNRMRCTSKTEIKD